MPTHSGSTLQLLRTHGWRIKQPRYPPHPSRYKHNSRIPLHQVVLGHHQLTKRSASLHFHHNNKCLKTMFPYPQISTTNNQIQGLYPPLSSTLLPSNLRLMLRLPNHLQTDIDATTVEQKHQGLSHQITPPKVVRPCHPVLAWQQLATSIHIQRKAAVLPRSTRIVERHHRPSTITTLSHSKGLQAKMT